MTIDTRARVAQYLKAHRDRLELLEKMWSDPRVQFYNDVALPRQKHNELAIFLVGPTSRHQILEYNWRCEAVAYLRAAGFEGFIFAPEPLGLEEDGDFTERDYVHHWESSRLLHPNTIPVIWIPRKFDEMLGLNTNLETGILIGKILQQKAYGIPEPKKVFVGWPDEAERMGLPRHYGVERAGLKRYTTLRELCFAAAEK